MFQLLAKARKEKKTVALFGLEGHSREVLTMTKVVPNLFEVLDRLPKSASVHQFTPRKKSFAPPTWYPPVNTGVPLKDIFEEGYPKRQGDEIIFKFKPDTKLRQQELTDDGNTFAEDILSEVKDEQKVVLDLGNVSFVDAVIVGQLITLNKKLGIDSKSLVLRHLQPSVYDSFRTKRLDHFIKIE